MEKTRFIRKNVSILRQTQEKMDELKKYGIVASDSEAIRRGVDLLHDAKIKLIKQEEVKEKS